MNEIIRTQVEMTVEAKEVDALNFLEDKEYEEALKRICRKVNDDIRAGKTVIIAIQSTEPDKHRQMATATQFTAMVI